MASTTAEKVTVIVSVLVFIVVIVFNALSATGSKSAIFVKLFNNKTNADVSNDFPVNITPAGYAFSIWGLIYTWQGVWLVYSLTTVFRRSAPVVLSYRYFAAFILGCVFNVSWLFVFANEKLPASLVVIFLSWASLVAALVFSYIDVQNAQPDLQKQHPKDTIFLHILVQNGISIITSWTTVATCINFSIVLVHSAGLSQTTGCCLALSLLTVLALVYYVLENFVFANALRFTFIPWLVVIWALIAILVKNYNSSHPESIFTLVLLILVGILLTVRVVLLFVRSPYRRSFNGMQLA